MTVSSRSSAATQRSIPDTVAQLRATFRSGRTKPVEWRLAQLQAIVRMVEERESEMAHALAQDLGRPAVDAWLADLAPVTSEAKYAIKKLRSWMRPTRVAVPIGVQPAKAWYQYEPLGVALIIGPWNYPLHLVLAPLVGAVAAGNCAVLKPSEHTPACSALLARLVPQYLDTEAIAVVEGAAEATQGLLDQAVDHCFFTGGPEIGKAVMAGAAKHLTPVTLELGGKSPVIVADDAKLKVAARRVAFAKLLNSGQTCVAPDYVLVDRSIRDQFVDELNKALDAFTDKPTLPLVNTRQAGRIAGLVEKAGGRTVRGGTVEADAKRAQLTVIVDPDAESDLMREEIFGPVLPLVTVDSMDDAIAHVQRGPKPLAVYLFSESRANEERVLNEISNGGTVINQLMYHLLVNDLPFGGVGNSGTGAYHGKWGFETFSHRKAVLRKPTWPDPSLAYPPFTKIKQMIMRKVF
ncbi:MAG TPA: aldehyde dehydrogenase family protein [Jatrophihabitans sp.]|jgi:aldehyde dehydrogenase (NAD+)|uniref:aldehyde dehydrogenase family protein n=1 Tax=Jatrophihabitans sp. TaxID=1932789 RepID=UPI002E083914|nr:aldehyde dehydrogenase family protein [Jatrophihabitans sp.]